MIYRKILIAGLLLQVTSLHGIRLGTNLLKNSPIEGLIDIAKALNDAEATLQIGQELCSRNAMNSMQLYDQVSGGVSDEPAEPYGYVQGMWVWIADTPEAEAGTWCWIAKTLPFYISILLGYGLI